MLNNNAYPYLAVEGKKYTIYSDDSKNGLGCVLMRDDKVTLTLMGNLSHM